MTEPTWSERLIRSALKIQNRIAPEVSGGLKKAGAGRKGKLVIGGEDGGTFHLRWSGKELVEDETDEGTRNEFYMHSQTLLDLATGELGARDAVAARLIRITGDRSLYDEEDIMQLLEKLQSKIARALGVV